MIIYPHPVRGSRHHHFCQSLRFSVNHYWPFILCLMIMTMIEHGIDANLVKYQRSRFLGLGCLLVKLLVNLLVHLLVNLLVHMLVNLLVNLLVHGRFGISRCAPETTMVIVAREDHLSMMGGWNMIPGSCKIAERSPQGWFRGRRQLAGRVWATAASGWEQPTPGRQAQDNHNIVSLPSDQVSFEDWSQFSWYSYLGCCWSGVTPAQGLSVLVPWWGWWWWWWWFKGGGWSWPWWFWFWWFFTGIRVSQGVAAIIRGDVRPKCRSNWKKKNNSNLFAFLKKTQSCWKWKTTHTICFNPASI